MRNPFIDESVTIEDDGNKVFLWLNGYPHGKNTTKIDATQAFLVGLWIGSGQFDKVKSQTVEIYK